MKSQIIKDGTRLISLKGGIKDLPGEEALLQLLN